PAIGYGDQWDLYDRLMIFQPKWKIREDKVPCGGCNCVAGTTSLKAGSMLVRIELGMVDHRTSAGYLFIQEDQPSSQLANSLRFSFDQNSALIHPTFDGRGALVQLLVPGNNT